MYVVRCMMYESLNYKEIIDLRRCVHRTSDIVHKQ
jgi:hypothetical protein